MSALHPTRPVDRWADTYYLMANPGFLPNMPRSYESTLCRMAGWWSDPVGASTLTPMELTLDLLLPVECFVPQREKLSPEL